MAKVGVTFDANKLEKRIAAFDERLRGNVKAVVDRRAALTTTDLKVGAHWTDRTGAARSGLMALPISTASAEEIFMAYSVTYGIWLETAHDRKYAIITPMMRIAGAALMNDLQHLIDRMS